VKRQGLGESGSESPSIVKFSDSGLFGFECSCLQFGRLL